nr:MAG TPA: hypothetical protein [Caudoviricetes sp.]
MPGTLTRDNKKESHVWLNFQGAWIFRLKFFVF